MYVTWTVSTDMSSSMQFLFCHGLGRVFMREPILTHSTDYHNPPMHSFLLHPSRRFRQRFDSPGSPNSRLTQRHSFPLPNTKRTPTSPAQLSYLHIRQSMVMFPMFHRPQASSPQVTSICRTHVSHGQCSSIQEMTRLCVRQRRRILLRVPSNRLNSHP